MILDIMIGIIVIVTMVLGFRKGFVYTFIHTIDWILAIVIAFIWSPKLKEILVANTDIYDTFLDNVEGSLDEQ